MTLSKFADSGSTSSVHGLTPSAAIFVLQQLVVRAYTHRTDVRERVRHLIVKYLLCVNQSTKDTERSSLDGGKTRAHVQHLLKILQAIIAGFQVTSDAEVYQQRRELLLDVLVPLHLPNEMIEWRDQIPVLQMYHEDLVKCVVALAQKSDEGYYTTTGRPTDSLLTEALMQVLRHWPESFNTNTPKQVLLLHEIEILVERLDVARLFPVHDALLVRLRLPTSFTLCGCSFTTVSPSPLILFRSVVHRRIGWSSALVQMQTTFALHSVRCSSSRTRR